MDRMRSHWICLLALCSWIARRRNGPDSPRAVRRPGRGRRELITTVAPPRKETRVDEDTLQVN
jgi:hypothetical protein